MKPLGSISPPSVGAAQSRLLGVLARRVARMSFLGRRGSCGARLVGAVLARPLVVVLSGSLSRLSDSADDADAGCLLIGAQFVPSS